MTFQSGMNAVLCLGRNGDILNALPMAYKIWKDTGEEPGFIAAKDYADILEGISYVKPVIYHGRFQDVGRAFDQFKGQYNIAVAQVYGSTWIPRCQSFCQDMWAQAGYEADFDRAELVFDRRDTDREKLLVQKYINGPTILVNLSGHSSPLWASEQILGTIQRTWGWRATVVNLAQIRCHRIYDLLGLFDTAGLLITSDTSTLHLARASSVPSVQFVVETPTAWHGSAPCGNCKLTIKYGQIIKRFTEVHATIAKYIL